VVDPGQLGEVYLIEALEVASSAQLGTVDGDRRRVGGGGVRHVLKLQPAATPVK
jgi:hypothetical protein